VRAVWWLLATALVTAACAPKGARPTLEAEARRIGAPLVGDEGAPGERAHIAILLEPDAILVDQHNWQSALRRAAPENPDIQFILDQPSRIRVDPYTKDHLVTGLHDRLEEIVGFSEVVSSVLELDRRVELIFPADTPHDEAENIMYTAGRAKFRSYLGVARTPLGATTIPFSPPYFHGPPWTLPCTAAIVSIGDDTIEVTRREWNREGAGARGRVDRCLRVDSWDEIASKLTWPSGPHLCREVRFSPIKGTRWQRVLELAFHLRRHVPDRPLVIAEGSRECYTGKPPRRFTSSLPPGQP
jgi:hypothetical protein